MGSERSGHGRLDDPRQRRDLRGRASLAGAVRGPGNVWALGFWPFIPGDIVKIAPRRRGAAARVEVGRREERANARRPRYEERGVIQGSARP